MTASGDDTTRLNKYLALELGISRRQADELIEQGKVAIDGETAVLGGRITPETVVTVSGQPVASGRKLEYMLFHKPTGYVCSRRRQGDNPTIYELLPVKYHHLKPVGRLDRDSSGLLLLSNDGDFAYRMTHPSFHKVKIYEVQLDHALQPLHQQMISDYGIQLEDGGSKFMIEKIAQPEHSARAPLYRITMSEGRNRQIRRTFAALGYTVTALHRTNFGDYSLGDMKSGDYKFINIQ